MLKQFIRNFRKQRVVGILNICCLSLGIMVSGIVGLWAINEFSFDRFHTDSERIYKVINQGDYNGERFNAAAAFEPLGKEAAAQILQIETMCRVEIETVEVEMDGTFRTGLRSIVTDHNFFNFFTFPLIGTTCEVAFLAPDNAIITESAAAKYFPGENPVGKSLKIHGFSFSISGVMRDFPRNSHIQGDLVFPFFGHLKDWGWASSFSYETYFRLTKNADVQRVEQHLNKIQAEGAPGLSAQMNSRIILVPIKEVHFLDTMFDKAIKGDKGILETFIFTALAILLMACINFTNLFVSTSFIRAKTIGIKKSQGATRASLILGFYAETACYVVISIVIGIWLVAMLLPAFNSYTGSDVAVGWTSASLYLFLGALALVTIILAGSYPALQMTREGILESIKGRARAKKMSILQRALVVTQCCSSIVLLVVVAFFVRQIDAMLSHDLGFDNTRVVYVESWGAFGKDFESLRREMIAHPAIDDVAIRQYRIPTEFGSGIGLTNPAAGDEMILVERSEVTANYFDFFHLQFAAGSNPFRLESEGWSRECVINQSAARMLGLTDPVNAPVKITMIGSEESQEDGATYIVRGVLKDAYMKSLHLPPGPEIYVPVTQYNRNPVFFKIVGDTQEAIAAIREKWEKVNPQMSFEYRLLENAYRDLYRSEVNSAKVLSLALVVSFVITLGGLFAMAYYSAQRRIKEIGIRKINGASMFDLLVLLNRGLMVQIGVAFLVACPVAWLFLDHWLKGFVVRTPLVWWIFATAGAITAVTALLTCAGHTWRIAKSNPVDSIKSE